MSNGLDVALMKNTFGPWSPKDGDRHTELAFSYSEWSSFFFDTLKAVQTEYVEGEPIQTYWSRQSAAFKESLLEYPLLARIEEFYRDSAFAPEEIDSLENELRRVQNLTLDTDATVFLDGMLTACEEATRDKLGIRLLSS